MEKLKVKILSLTDTKNLAIILSKILQSKDILLFQGDLASGKTTFIKYLINALQKEKTEITSPTFNIIQSFDSKIGTINHLDLYRIKDQNELFYLGIEEILDNTCLIEWSENLGVFKPNENFTINIRYLNENTREFEFIATKNYYPKIIELKKHYES